MTNGAMMSRAEFRRRRARNWHYKNSASYAVSSRDSTVDTKNNEKLSRGRCRIIRNDITGIPLSCNELRRRKQQHYMLWLLTHRHVMMKLTQTRIQEEDAA